MTTGITKSLYISYNAMTEPIVQSQVLPYLEGLSKQGVHFQLLTFEKEKMSADEKEGVTSALRKRFEDECFCWHVLSYHKTPSVPATIFDIVVGFFCACAIALRQKVDVIHSRAIVAAAIGYPVAQICRAKFIFDTRGIDSEEYVDAKLWKRGGLTHRVVSFLEKSIICSSDYVVVLTQRFFEILQAKYAVKKIRFAVIPCAVDTNRFMMRQKKNEMLVARLGLVGKFIIVYAGSIGTWYMLQEMTRFFMIARTIIPNAHFLILTQMDRNYIMEEVKKAGLETDSFSVYSVSHDVMPEYLSIADLGIFFIKQVFSKLSSSPVKFAEYLSMGLPVVINTRIGDTDKLVESNGVGAVINRFNDGSYLSAILAIKQMLAEDKVALRERCRKTAEAGLSLKMAVERYRRVYSEILEKDI